jgi:hypothetical protein
MLISMTAELQIRQDEGVQSWSFAFISDAGWSLRRAEEKGRRRLEPAPSGGGEARRK